jgi:hypothetical protein
MPASNYQVYKNVLCDAQIKRWQKYYVQEATFMYNSVDREQHGTSFLQNTGWGLKRSIEMFGIDTWIDPYIKPTEPRVKANHFHDAYLNALLSGDDFCEHEDISGLTDDQYYVSCVLMLNPYMTESDAGFMIGDTHIPYEFNQLIVFNGTQRHKPLAPKQGWVRLSYYCSFSNAFKVRFNPNSVGYNNPWHRDIKTNKNLK